MTGTNDDAQPKTEPPGPAEPAGDVVPRLPRGRGLRLSRPELLRVAGLAILLVFLIVTRRSCADAVSRFVTSFGDRGSGAATPRPGTVDRPGSPSAAGPPVGAAGAPAASTAPSAAGSGADGDGPAPGGYEHLRPGMTDDEVKAVIDRARARSAGPPGP